MEIAEFQRRIERTYFERDARRGVAASFLWFLEEVGELATAIRSRRRDALAGEFADVLAWLSTLGSIEGIELEEAVRKYEEGCPGCHQMPCICSQKT